MDKFDKLLKSQAQSEKWGIPSNVDDTINSVLSDLPNNKVYKKTSLRILVAAALIATVTTTTVFAANSTSAKDAINNVIAYFNPKVDSKYISDKENLQKFSSVVGITSVDKGIKLTVDSIAVDDNFLNIFYTIESDKPITKDENKVFSAYFASPYLDYKINGKVLEISNNNDMEAYFESDYKLKGMKRENLSNMSSADKLVLEVSTEKIFNTDGKWNISTEVDKSKAKVDTKIITPKQKESIVLNSETHNITIDKVSISPLGNQIVISENTPNIKSQFTDFALLDENGKVLEVLGSDMFCNDKGKSTNAFEFIKPNRNIKQMTLVPIESTGQRVPGAIVEINKFPINFKLWGDGGIVVDNISFTQNQMKIIYHNQGVVMAEKYPYFSFYDKDGKEIELDKGALVSAVDRQSGRHIQTYTSYNNSYDFSKINKISTLAYKNTKLLYDKQIKIDLTN